jgi:hypothetical protein
LQVLTSYASDSLNNLERSVDGGEP